MVKFHCSISRRFCEGAVVVSRVAARAAPCWHSGATSTSRLTPTPTPHITRSCRTNASACMHRRSFRSHECLCCNWCGRGQCGPAWYPRSPPAVLPSTTRMARAVNTSQGSPGPWPPTSSTLLDLITLV